MLGKLLFTQLGKYTTFYYFMTYFFIALWTHALICSFLALFMQDWEISTSFISKSWFCFHFLICLKTKVSRCGQYRSFWCFIIVDWVCYFDWNDNWPLMLHLQVTCYVVCYEFFVHEYFLSGQSGCWCVTFYAFPPIWHGCSFSSQFTWQVHPFSGWLRRSCSAGCFPWSHAGLGQQVTNFHSLPTKVEPNIIA